jgi:hypothetical protein
MKGCLYCKGKIRVASPRHLCATRGLESADDHFEIALDSSGVETGVVHSGHCAHQWRLGIEYSRLSDADKEMYKG